MTILLSQLFSPAMLVATVFSPESDAPATIVRTRSPSRLASIESFRSATAKNRLLDTVFGLVPMLEERPYAL